MTVSPSRSARSTRRRTIAAGGAIAAAAITVLALTLDDPDPRDKQGGKSAATVESTTPAPVDESLLALARRDSGDAGRRTGGRSGGDDRVLRLPVPLLRAFRP